MALNDAHNHKLCKVVRAQWWLMIEQACSTGRRPRGRFRSCWRVVLGIILFYIKRYKTESLVKDLRKSEEVCKDFKLTELQNKQLPDLHFGYQNPGKFQCCLSFYVLLLSWMSFSHLLVIKYLYCNFRGGVVVKTTRRSWSLWLEKENPGLNLDFSACHHAEKKRKRSFQINQDIYWIVHTILRLYKYYKYFLIMVDNFTAGI